MDGDPTQELMLTKLCDAASELLPRAWQGCDKGLTGVLLQRSHLVRKFLEKTRDFRPGCLTGLQGAIWALGEMLL